jgi:hypothetical protein
MPKGKAKKDNPDLYQGSPESEVPSMAPQAVAHRRGGTHKVRDQDRTDSIYDTYNYKELLDTAKERGIYRRDMKKVEMAFALKHNDEEKRRAENDALTAHQRAQELAKKEEVKKAAEKQKLINAKQKKRVEKEKRRARDESVSDDTMSDAEMEAEEVTRDEYKRGDVGQALSDESWDSTSTESSTHSVNRPIEHDSKLRLFEWPYEEMPPLHKSVQLPGHFWVPEQLPWQASYAPLKIVTTISKQKLFLPGLKYPAGVDPDFVPILNTETRNAVRNGHLIGVLRKASIEKATDWAQRTTVQGWNARMYFSLGTRNEAKDLAETYNKWYLENHRLLRVKGNGDDVSADREKRHMQRVKNKGRKTAEVYDASQYRPLAMGYLPAYLDYGFDEEQEERRTLENLYYVRFPGCDVPHYYIWTKEGEWADPTVANRAWDSNNPQVIAIEDSETDESDECWEDVTRKYPRKTWKPTITTWMRVKKSDILQPTSPLSETSNMVDTLTYIEHELFETGLAATLAKYSMEWLGNGKQHAWKVFARALPTLYPSGQIPEAPPIESSEGAKLAVKLAMIDSLEQNDQTPLSPLRGNEGWTRDDDTFWDVVEVEAGAPALPTHVNSAGGHEQGFVEEVDLEEISDADAEALYRRSSLAFAHLHGEKEGVLKKWLELVSPSYIPPATPIDWAEEVNGEYKDVFSDDDTLWEKKYLPKLGEEGEVIDECAFWCLPWDGMSTEDRATHMLSHSTSSRRPSTPYSILSTTRRLTKLKANFPRLSFETGMDGDVDTPRKSAFARNPEGALRLNTRRNDEGNVTKRQRRLLHTDHPEAAYNPRKRSLSTIDSLEFLENPGTTTTMKPRKTTVPKIKILPHRPSQHGGDDDDVSPCRLLMLGHRKSGTEYPTYKPSTSASKPRKKRKIDDPTYRDTLPSPESDEEEVIAPVPEDQKASSELLYESILPSPVLSDRKLPLLKSRKRKNTRDRTYKGGAITFADSEDDPQPAPLKKRKKTADPTYCNPPDSSDSDDENPVHPVLKHRGDMSGPVPPVLSDRKLTPLNSKKRKSLRDETYKGGSIVFESSQPALRPILKKRKTDQGSTHRGLVVHPPLSSSATRCKDIRKGANKRDVRRVSKIVRFVEVPKVVPDFGRNLWLAEDRKRKAECLELDDGGGVQDGGGWRWCAVM